ncbi:MAG: MlaD family protein, partial [Desulfovibrio sp.]|nr:MlaD family protein [Desulfovibrio sp.]
MEIRANYIMVGLFTLAVLLGGVSFTLWIGTRDKGMPQDEYDISFSESVKGLSVNSDVLFIGIRVGKVTQIKISNLNPGEVRVRIAVNSDTPVRKNSTAQLESLGITGASVVSISGGTADSPLLDVPEGAVGEIPAEPSTLASVFSQMPDVLAKATHVLNSIGKVFSNENVASVTSMLRSLDEVSLTLSKRAATIDTIIGESEKLLANIERLSANANQMLATDVRQTSQAMSRIAARVDSTLMVMEPGLKQFSSQGLADMRMLMVDMRNLVHVLTRVG